MVCNLNVRALSNNVVVFITPVAVRVHCELEGNVQRELEGSDHRLGLEQIPATYKRAKNQYGQWTFGTLGVFRIFSDFLCHSGHVLYFGSFGHLDTWTYGHLDILTGLIELGTSR